MKKSFLSGLFVACSCGGKTDALTSEGGSILLCSDCHETFANPLFCTGCKKEADQIKDGGKVIACSGCKISWPGMVPKFPKMVRE